MTTTTIYETARHSIHQLADVADLAATAAVDLDDKLRFKQLRQRLLTIDGHLKLDIFQIEEAFQLVESA